MTFRTCRKCDDEQPLKCFAKSKGYHIYTCNSCRALYGQKLTECKRNRVFNALASWPSL